MKTRRKHHRIIKRLEIEFSAENKNYRAISSDLSLNGLFIRTNHAFSKGTILYITVYLPDGTNSKLKGRVIRSIKTSIAALKNGMGVELIDVDSYYIKFINSLSSGDQTKPPDEEVKPETVAKTKTDETTESTSSDYLILNCSKCGVKNKVKRTKMSQVPKCGKCGASLVILA